MANERHSAVRIRARLGMMTGEPGMTAVITRPPTVARIRDTRASAGGSQAMLDSVDGKKPDLRFQHILVKEVEPR